MCVCVYSTSHLLFLTWEMHDVPIHTKPVQAILIVSGFTHHMLFTLPNSPCPSSQQELDSVLKPLEIILSALRESQARRSSVHDQLYIGQNGSLTGGSSTNLFEFAVLCFSRPFSTPEMLSREHEELENYQIPRKPEIEDYSVLLRTAIGATVPHRLTAQALLRLSVLPSTPVWLSIFMLAAATTAMEILDPPMLSRLLAATSHVVKRVLRHSCIHRRTMKSRNNGVGTSDSHLAQPASTRPSAGLAACGYVSVHRHSFEPNSSGPGSTACQPASPQQRASNGRRHPEVSTEHLLDAAKATCMRAQTDAQVSAAFAVLQRISGDLAVAMKQWSETCCPAAASRRLFDAFPATPDSPASATEAHRPTTAIYQGPAIVQVLSCSNTSSLSLIHISEPTRPY